MLQGAVTSEAFNSNYFGDRYLVEVDGVSGMPISGRELKRQLPGLVRAKGTLVYRESFYHGQQGWHPLSPAEIKELLDGERKR